MTDTAAPPPFSEVDDARTKAIEHSMRERGEPLTEPVAVDYFAFDDEYTVMLPDGVQWVSHKVLNEGARRKYSRDTNKDVKLQRASGDAYLRMAPGEDRASLLETAITGWNLFQHGKSFPYTKTNVKTILEVFPPSIIDVIHKDIMKYNPWLLGEMTIEDIDREMDTLKETRERLVQEQAGKGSS